MININESDLDLTSDFINKISWQSGWECGEGARRNVKTRVFLYRKQN